MQACTAGPARAQPRRGTIQASHHRRPRALDPVADPVAPVEGFHVLQVRAHLGGDAAWVDAHRDAQITRERDAADGIPELEVALGVNEVRGQGQQ